MNTSAQVRMLTGLAVALIASACSGATQQTPAPTAAPPTSPSPTQTAPAPPSVSATSSTGVVESPLPSASIPAAAQIDARIEQIHVGNPIAPRWFASDGRSLWVHEDTGLVRLDLKTSAIVGRVPMDPIDYGYVTSGAGAIWQTDFDRNTVVRIDPTTGKVVASIPLPDDSAPEGVAVTPGAVWVADHHGGAISRLDPKTNRVVATIPVGPTGADGPLTMTAGPEGVWVYVPNMRSVVRIDPATNRVGLLVPLDGPVASDGKEVWIGAGPNGLPQVVRIDPDSGKIITAVTLETGSGNLAVGLGSVWVMSGGITRIDEATGRIISRIDLGNDGGDVIVAGGAVWVTAEGQPYVLRISPN